MQGLTVLQRRVRLAGPSQAFFERVKQRPVIRSALAADKG
jgi:hypothetical protein